MCPSSNPCLGLRSHKPYVHFLKRRGRRSLLTTAIQRRPRAKNLENGCACTDGDVGGHAIACPLDRPHDTVHRVVKHEAPRGNAPHASIFIPRRPDLARPGARRLDSHFSAPMQKAPRAFALRASIFIS